MILNFHLNSDLKDDFEFLKKYKNTLVLEYIEVVKLVSLVTDPNEHNEPYWIIERFSRSKYKQTWCSTLIPLIPLKGKISAKEYKELVRVWKLNEDRIKESEKENKQTGENKT